MTARDRQRRLHVMNRLEELAARHGPVEIDTPEELDHMPAWAEAALGLTTSAHTRENLHIPKETAQEPPAPRAAPRPSQRPQRASDW